MFEDQNQKTEDIFSETDKTPLASAGPAVLPRPSAALGPPSALSQGKLQPVKDSGANSGVVPGEQLSGANVAFPFKKALAIGLISLTVIGGAFGGWFWWQTRIQTKPAPSLGAPEGEAKTTQTTAAPEDNRVKTNDNTVGSKLDETYDKLNQGAVNRALDPLGSPQEPESTPAAPGAVVDADQDGLSDEQEFSQGTNPRLVDSDSDGLSDWEEVSIFGTDPLKVDSDGDRFPDGEEVQNGYNPKGPGKLLDFDKAKENIR